MLDVVEVPWPRLMSPAPHSVKPGAAVVTTRGIEADWVPDIPMIVALYWPAATALEAVSVSRVELVVGLGEKDAAIPLGRPVTAKLTLPVNPSCGFT